jgi:hypothetical protein
MSTSRQISAAYIFEHFPLGLAYAADQKKKARSKDTEARKHDRGAEKGNK